MPLQDRAELRRVVRDSLVVSGDRAQTSFSVLQDTFDLGGRDVLKALTPLPGVALRGETCGAVTACLMAIGLMRGRDRRDDRRGYLTALVPARDPGRRARRIDRFLGDGRTRLPKRSRPPQSRAPRWIQTP